MIKAIPGFINYYASDDGQILSRWSGQLKPLRQSQPNGRYKQVDFGKQGMQSVHRLILLTFVGEPPEGCVACHNNGVADDNRLSNLRWDTVANNELDKYKHGSVKYGEDTNSVKLTETDVKDIRWMLGMGVKQKELAAMYNVRQSNISSIKLGKTWR